MTPRKARLPVVRIVATGSLPTSALRGLVLEAVHEQLDWQTARWAEPSVPYTFEWGIYGSRLMLDARNWIGAVIVEYIQPDEGPIEDRRQERMRL